MRIRIAVMILSTSILLMAFTGCSPARGSNSSASRESKTASVDSLVGSDSNTNLSSDMGSSSLSSESPSQLSSFVESSQESSRSFSEPNASTSVSSSSGNEVIYNQQMEQYVMKINQSTGYDDALTGKNLYLTIDDGPSGNNTPKVLATLKKCNVKATFFVCGPDTPAVRSLIRQEFDDGHAIGIHCYSHQLKPLYQSEESYFADFDKIEKLVYEVTGVKPTLYRFPGGTNTSYIKKELSERIIVKLKERGYEYYDWNVSSGDSQPYSPEEITSHIVSQCEKRKKSTAASIILMHDSVSRVSSADALETFVTELQKKGYYFSTLNHHVKPVHFVK